MKFTQKEYKELPSTAKKYISLGKQHRIAVCFSGLSRQLEYTHKRWKDYFATFPCPYDIFAYIGESPDAHKMKKYFPQAIVKIAKDPDIDPNHPLIRRYITNTHDKQRKVTWALQIYDYKQVNLMRKEKEKKENFKYNVLVRLRTDFFPSTQYYFPRRIHMNTIYIQDMRHFGGINDRFALGNADLMNTYMNIFDSFTQENTTCYSGTKWVREIYRKYFTPVEPSIKRWYGTNFVFWAEIYLSHWLRLHNITIKLFYSKADYIKQNTITRYHKYMQDNIVSDWHFPWHIALFWRLRYIYIHFIRKYSFSSIIHWMKYFLRTNKYSKKLYKRIKKQ